MKQLRRWLKRVGGLAAGARHEQEFADELAAHLEMQAEENIRRGLAPEEARRVALARLGPESVRQRYREQRSVPLVEHWLQDIRYAARTLRRSPGFALVALATIALGVAGPTVMFAMAKQWVLDPLPFAEPDRLLDLRNLDTVSGNSGGISVADFLDWQREASTVEQLAAYRRDDVALSGTERAERLRSAEVTSNFFTMLGAQARVGQVFAPGPDSPAATSVVISDTMWRRVFQADPGIIGRQVVLDNEQYSIAGVLPADFQFTLLGAIDVWRPLVFSPEERSNRRSRSLLAVGRLQTGRTVEDARTELQRIAAQLAAAYPDTNGRRSVRVLSLADEVRLHHDAGVLIPILFAMMICVLLVACVNVTNVMFARSSTRRQEMAVRLALGASRTRIVGQWMVEHLLLFLIAGAAGAVLAMYGTEWTTRSIPAENRQYLRNFGVLTVDGAVIAFALAVSAACGLMFGMMPAWMSARANVSADLRDATTRTSGGRTGARLRSALVVSEVALALTLLVTAGLLVATARNIVTSDVGFDRRQMLTFQLSLDGRRYQSPADVRAFYDRLLPAVETLPRVRAAAAATLVPFGGDGNSTEVFVDEQPDTAPADTAVASVSDVSASYPTTLGLRLISGRLLNATDAAEAPRTALINTALASRYFAGRDPIGRSLRVRRGSTDRWQIVGVVAPVKNYQAQEAEEPQVYLPLAQTAPRSVTAIVRADGDLDALVPQLRATVAAIDPAEPVADVATMEERIARSTAPFSIVATFVTFFGAVTLLLAGVGVYGVVAYSFAQRTREIGIRMALGARRADVGGLVLRQLRFLLAAGVVPGLVLAWLLGQAMKALLFGITPGDWRLYVAMTALLALVALVAVLVPARRAAAIEPTVALHDE